MRFFLNFTGELTTSLVIVGLHCIGFGFATPIVHHQQNSTWPSSYFALGDSYASGQGAGRYFKKDYETKLCNRFDGAYPVELSSQLFFGVKQDAWPFKFPACSWNFLSDIKGQIAKLQGQKADLVTLSISGNDFGFADVISNCIYSLTQKDQMDAACVAASTEARRLLLGDDLWNDYKDVVKKILRDVVNPDTGVLAITGYARFFAAPIEGDICSKKRFPLFKPFIGKTYAGNKIHVHVREEMNEGVDVLNARVQQEIVTLDSDRIIFVDINNGFEGKRFCEPNRKDPFQANNDRVQFFSVGSKMKEKAVKPPKSVTKRYVAEQNLTSAPSLNIFNLQSSNSRRSVMQIRSTDFRLPSDMQISSIFHPKRGANKETANSIKAALDKWRVAHGL